MTRDEALDLAAAAVLDVIEQIDARTAADAA